MSFLNFIIEVAEFFATGIKKHNEKQEKYKKEYQKYIEKYSSYDDERLKKEYTRSSGIKKISIGNLLKKRGHELNSN